MLSSTSSGAPGPPRPGAHPAGRRSSSRAHRRASLTASARGDSAVAELLGSKDLLGDTATVVLGRVLPELEPSSVDRVTALPAGVFLRSAGR
ncbi:hypothetical protein [Lentzea sp. NPDC060358]|uniref:hypothetical protein n=1 Tax=Lentzea sp. NPDC060358 TaxID=3347103 RepID=UPI00364EB199